MSNSPRHTATSLGVIALLTILFAAVPASSQSISGGRIDFGATESADVLDGGARTNVERGSVAISGGPGYYRDRRHGHTGIGRYWPSPNTDPRLSGHPAVDSRFTSGSHEERSFHDRPYRDPRFHARRGFDHRFHSRPLPRVRNEYRRLSPSIYLVERSPRSTYFRGTGVFANANPASGSVVNFYAQAPETGLEESGGPKFIDVASERLDRQPIGPDGISVQYAGSSKIIRIAPSYRMSEAARDEEMEVAALRPAPSPAGKAPVPSPAPRPDAAAAPAGPEPEASAESEPEEMVQESAEGAPEPSPPAALAPALEPWTEEWMRDCVARHESFDASLGTYTDENGRRRFCTGDPA